jgi:hypothetical protein
MISGTIAVSIIIGPPVANCNNRWTTSWRGD